MNSLPSRDQIRQWLAENPGQSSKRDIARAFGLKGAARMELKRLLREMEDEGGIARKARHLRTAGALPPVAVLKLRAPDAAGDLFAEPAEAGLEDDAGPILVVTKPGDPALGAGDRILARLTRVDGADHAWEARLIRRLGAGPVALVGIFRKTAEGGRILPVAKGEDREWRVAAADAMGARDGELVEGQSLGNRRLGLPQARITARLGDPSGPRAVSLIAIHQHAIPDRFDDATLAEADSAPPFTMAHREDLRHLDFVTIDPADARDRDDAVLAMPDDDPANPGGHVIWVAIADVANYVRPGSALDREARRRGNSTYFPDRVVPMLPDVLSGDLCSLHDHADRPCIAVRLRIDAAGHKRDHRFTRAVMRSRGSLEYLQVQRALDGLPDAQTAPLIETVLRPLHAAYRALMRARALRQPLDLDLPERQIVLSDDGRVLSVAFRERADTHRLIEEFMVLANVAAAEELSRRRQPVLYRIHEEPAPEKIDALRKVVESAGLTLARGHSLKTAQLNGLLARAEGSEYDDLINISTLRAMTQACYATQNLGHFGLALKEYAHFTSPIRRYADLIIHRALIRAHGWGDDGLSAEDIATLDETATLISDAERRSMAAERDTVDRYLAAWLSERIGATFAGHVSGVQRFGLFVRLDEAGADGLVPIRTIGREFFHYDPDSQTLMGADTGLTIGLGQKVTVRLAEAAPQSGGLVLELVDLGARPLPSGIGPRAARLGRARRKLASSAPRRRNGNDKGRGRGPK